MMMMATIEAASIGMWDSLILMVMALVVFGPRRLPEIGRQIGKLMYEVRKASNDFKFQMEDELRKAEEADRRKKDEEARNREQGIGVRDQVPALAASADSQLPKTGPGATGSGSTGVESPYPGERVYPEVSPAEYQQQAAYPQIQPPSTGEPVAADPPGRMSARLEFPDSEGAVAALPESAGPVVSEYGVPGASAAEAPVGDTTPSSEHAHHG
ncbi:MAG: twin-arginine translocase TatA/TatE family subunit [Terracidiphilus sp.]|jgi:sec-independent protein translocase protein TatB